MTEEGVIYFNINKKCLVRLLVSIYSLRRFYDGPVALLNAGGDEGIAAIIANALNVYFDTMEVKKLRKHTAYNAKSSVWRCTPFDRTVFIDADTVVSGPINELFLGDAELILTAFGEWRSNGRPYKKRCLQWSDISCDRLNVQETVNLVINHPYYAINTGVFRFDCEPGEQPKFLVDWESLTNSGAGKCAFTDEVAMQLLYVAGIPEVQVVSDMWNASPIYTQHDHSDVRIWHMHGSKHVTRENGRGWQGANIWWPLFQEVWEHNVADVREWAPMEDKQLRRSLAWKVLNS